MYSHLVNNLAESLIVKQRRQMADVIVVLSSGAFNDGTLGYFTLLRTLQGIKLYREGLADKIIFSGGNMPGNRLDLSISQKMAEIASENGVPEKARIIEEKSLTTYQNAVETKKIMEKYKLKDALLVTSAIHMKRAMLTFERAGVMVYPVPANAFETAVTDPLDRLGMFREVIREYAGMLFYRWKGWM